MGFTGMVLHGSVFSILWSSRPHLAALPHQLSESREPLWPLEDTVVEHGTCRLTDDSGPLIKVGGAGGLEQISWHLGNTFYQNSLIVLDSAKKQKWKNIVVCMKLILNDFPTTL